MAIGRAHSSNVGQRHDAGRGVGRRPRCRSATWVRVSLPHALRSNAKVRPCLLLSSRVASFVGLRYARFVIVLCRGEGMTAPTPDSVELPTQRYDQAKARLDPRNPRIPPPAP